MESSSAVAEPVSKPSLLAKSVALHVQLSKPGNRARVPMATVEVSAKYVEDEERKAADHKALHLSKELFECPEYRAVRQLDSEIRMWLRVRALPSILRGGVYLIPIGIVEQTNTYLDDMELKRAALVETFLAVYPGAVKKAKDVLGELYRETDYPSIAAMRSAFSMERQYLSFDTPTSLKQLRVELFQQEAAKAQARWVEAEQEIQQLLRAQMADLVEHMTDRLSPDADGKCKIFRNSLTENITEFLNAFDARNVTDDKQLAELVGKARLLLSGVSPDSLRKSDALRVAVETGFSEIKATLGEMVIKKPSRFIALDGEA